MSFKPKEGRGEPRKDEVIRKGHLLDSLDLNIGYESIQKLKEGWGF